MYQWGSAGGTKFLISSPELNIIRELPLILMDVTTFHGIAPMPISALRTIMCVTSGAVEAVGMTIEDA